MTWTEVPPATTTEELVKLVMATCAKRVVEMNIAKKSRNERQAKTRCVFGVRSFIGIRFTD
jgi:hypothetical protein